MPRSKNDSGLYEPKGTTHFNLKYKGADAISNRILARDLKECRYSDIEWVWIVEAGRRATPDEIDLIVWRVQVKPRFQPDRVRLDTRRFCVKRESLSVT